MALYGHGYDEDDEDEDDDDDEGQTAVSNVDWDVVFSSS